MISSRHYPVFQSASHLIWIYPNGNISRLYATPRTSALHMPWVSLNLLICEEGNYVIESVCFSKAEVVSFDDLLSLAAVCCYLKSKQALMWKD